MTLADRRTQYSADWKLKWDGTEWVPVRKWSLTLFERICFWTVVDAETGCWNWRGGVTGGGYGQLCYGGVTSPAHRLSYELFVGPIPDGLFLDHAVCHNRRCCNPDHLEPVTPAENQRRGRQIDYHTTGPTACRRGHPASERRMYGTGGGVKTSVCIACRKVLRDRKREQCS